MAGAKSSNGGYKKEKKMKTIHSKERASSSKAWKDLQSIGLVHSTKNEEYNSNYSKWLKECLPDKRNSSKQFLKEYTDSRDNKSELVLIQSTLCFNKSILYGASIK